MTGHRGLRSTALIFTLAAFSISCATLNPPASGVRRLRLNGVELHYLDRGKGQPVVFVHGGLDDYRYWTAQIEPFAEKYRVIAYSRRYNYPNDNGLSDSAHSAMIDAEDLAGLIRELHLEPAHVVGASYGAYSALFLASRHPHLVRTLVLAEAPVLRWLPNLPDGAAEFDGFMTNLWQPARQAFQNRDSNQALRITIDWFIGQGFVLPAASFDELPEEIRVYLQQNAREWEALTTSRDAFPQLSRSDVQSIKRPVLLLSGERTLRLHKLIDAEMERLLDTEERVIVPNVSHDIWGGDPELTREVTLKFLAQH